ncbi:MAG: UDP-N-acetylmuramate--L-alanine ligase [Planctomycetes bacterium]|nr:UDP-N-acetylmuramate--L-alanine ligase [Planctomycetota bacterium]
MSQVPRHRMNPSSSIPSTSLRPVEVEPRLVRSPSDLRQTDKFDVRGKHVYMIGIGGCGMSGLARLLASRGASVSGSDMAPGKETRQLQDLGIEVLFDQKAGLLPPQCDLVVASAAIKPDHPEWQAALRRDIPIKLYAQALGGCMLGRTGIAIAGTHGKSTTTALLGCMLVDADLEPSVIVGATCKQLWQGCLQTPAGAQGSGFRFGKPAIPTGPLAGKPGILVAEACEYERSFHNFRPLMACITSVEADHLDVYGSLDAVIESFRQFASLIPAESEGGYLLIGHDGAHRREVASGLPCLVETIGHNPQADWVVEYEPATRHVTLISRSAKGFSGQIAQWQMQIPGAHNALNAATAMVLALRAGGDVSALAQSASHFRGIDRRSQLIGEVMVESGGLPVRVYDDYGHHPTEIEVTLRALREFEGPQDRGGRLICVFQPHQHSRTRHLLNEFASAFDEADVVLLPDIYFVRDSIEDKLAVSSADLVRLLMQRGKAARHIAEFAQIVAELRAAARPGDLIVVMGAGPVWKVAYEYCGVI